MYDEKRMRYLLTLIAVIAMFVQSGCSPNEPGDAASAKCGDLAADAGDAGNFFFDTTSRLTAPTEPVRLPPLAADVELRGSADFQGTVEPSDPLFKRVGNLGCVRPPPGYEYYGEIYTVRLVGPGPHNLVADTCGSPQGDSMLFLYQDSEGSSHPMDLEDTCPHAARGKVGVNVTRITGSAILVAAAFDGASRR
jgi:hypothetical protein